MITFEDVTKSFPGGTTAVDHLDLEMPTAKITVLVGPSGCGKTTTLRMINRMVEPTSGTIRLDGEDIAEADPPKLRRRIGYVIQQAGLVPHRTVRDNIATVPYLLGWDRRRARARATELMELVGLPEALGRRYPYQLSGGQQQRVGVARALAADPPVLLMDEPFSAVDPVVRRSLQDELLRLQADLHKTIVFVTHDIDEAVRIGDMVCVLRQGGRIGQYATPERLLAAPADDFVAEFLGEDRGVRRLAFINSEVLPLRDDPPTGPVVRAFRHGVDSLRAALDSAVLNPSGQAVGVDAEGRVLGTATQADVVAAIGHLDSQAPQPVAVDGGDPR